MRYLITAGPTREPIDDVRFISNRSSGRMGLAIAEAALDAGHEVTLVMAQSASCAPELEGDESESPRLTVEWFDTTADLAKLLDKLWREHDVLIMAAAVADYRPIRRAQGKLPRGDAGLTLDLEPTPDLVAHAAAHRRPGQIIVAFAVEEASTLVDRATQKLARKGVDAIVANPLSTMDAAEVTATWLVPGRPPEPCGRMTKAKFGRWLVQQVDRLKAR